MTPRNVLLEGLTGAYNAGAEGILRGTVAILRQTFPDARVRFASLDPALDRRIVGDLDLEVVDARARTPLPGRLVNRALRALGAPPLVGGAEPLFDLARRADCVLSVGGDLYTLWPGERRADRFQLVERTAGLLAANPRLFLWGASVGPFDANPEAERQFRAALARMPRIFAREPVTLEYLAALGLGDRTVAVGDPAFLMDPADADDPEVRPHLPAPGRNTLGVNLSPFSVHHVLDHGRVAPMTCLYADRLAALLDARPELHLMLIPHVETPADPSGDDYGFLESVLRALPDRHAGRARLLPRGLRARRLKRLVASCDALIAARMHCAIAGMTSAVPTLLVSYSAKSQGMARYFYGDDRLVIPVDGDDDAFGAAVALLLDGREALRGRLAARAPEARADARRAGDLLAEALAAPAPAPSAAPAGR